MTSFVKIENYKTGAVNIINKWGIYKLEIEKINYNEWNEQHLYLTQSKYIKKGQI